METRILMNKKLGLTEDVTLLAMSPVKMVILPHPRLISLRSRLHHERLDLRVAV